MEKVIGYTRAQLYASDEHIGKSTLYPTSEAFSKSPEFWSWGRLGNVPIMPNVRVVDFMVIEEDNGTTVYKPLKFSDRVLRKINIFYI